MLNGLDLFSGIGGIALALAPWVRPFAYCEIERYCQAVLLAQMGAGALPVAPIWDDVQTLGTEQLTGKRIGQPLRGGGTYQHDDGDTIDIITGGFPCQDISVAGTGKGLAGERSGLFYEILRLAGELRPEFIFLENVPAITARGGVEVVGAITALGYDCRWCVISAASVGANHKRDRWFLLAHAQGSGWQARCRDTHRNNTPPSGIETSQLTRSGSGILEENLADPAGGRLEKRRRQRSNTKQEQPTAMRTGQMADAQHSRCQGWDTSNPGWADAIMSPGWWATEPDVGRVAHGIPHRVDKLTGLGNAVVPLQARTAFKILSGIK